MAKTEYIKIPGKLSWVKTSNPNKWHKWTVTVHPTPDGLELVRNLQADGVKNVLSKDEDGWKVTFSRPTSKEIKGKVVGLVPPEVFQADGVTPLRDILVGNGSDGVVKLEVYTHGIPGSDKKAKAARFLSLRIDNLIPFELKRDFDEDGQRAAEGLDKDLNSSEQLF